ncbi:nitroreductase family protein [Deinococcus peraridilitoris]|uniref:Nitroreductase n=1 Tax=Deinococcus peraridilitoris (strain DSM 19664 / LMG 22246 / CIP 109416 / KR-200) TaxID=937777 RepID=K9ZZP9_DEIPD|nr:nitroreductase family protein [Deinococcus peraridilitoris]AFZ66240.1 nitroreductase [Deinococcus peraridilitoris DSM 19664]
MTRPKPSFQELYPGYPEPVFEPLVFHRLPPQEMQKRAEAFYRELSARRTTRHFSTESVSRQLIELAVLSAGTAPSGAHRQPWRFVAVQDPELKRRIREAAEEEEFRTYTARMPEEWRAALAPLGTDYVKEHLTDAPWVVVVFREKFGLRPDGSTYKNYYTTESVAIAVGLFIAAVHHMGLTTLTHTPNPMAFLGELLGRPRNEEAMLVLPVGYPAPGAQVPRLQRKALREIFQVDAG